MKLTCWATLASVILSAPAWAGNTFVVTGTAIPSNLLEHVYGKLPKAVAAYDLNICNVSGTKQSIVSSEIFQALSQSVPGLQPIGRQIMLAEMLRSQGRSATTLANVVIHSITGVLTILSSAKYNAPSGLVTAAGLGSISAQQILGALKPVLTTDQLERFESEVLEQALVLDSGSCVERTVFTVVTTPAGKPQPLSFRVR